MQALRLPGRALPADATWQKLLLLTTELFYEKSGLLPVLSDYKNNADSL